MAKTIRELSEQLTAFQNIVIASQDKIKEEIKLVREAVSEMAEEMKVIKQTAISAKELALKNTRKIDQLASQLTELSDRNRRANLILAGISEELNNKALEETIREWIEENGVKVQPQEIERAHRLQRRRGGGNPRDVIVKFTREKLQQEVYKTLKKKKDLAFRGKKVWVREDFSQETIKKRNQMRPFGQRLYDNNVKFSWGYPSSIIIFKDGKRLIAQNPKEAKELFKQLGLDASDLRDQEMEEDIEETEDPGEGTSVRGEKRQRMDSQEETT